MRSLKTIALIFALSALTACGGGYSVPPDNSVQEAHQRTLFKAQTALLARVLSPDTPEGERGALTLEFNAGVAALLLLDLPPPCGTPDVRPVQVFFTCRNMVKHFLFQ